VDKEKIPEGLNRHHARFVELMTKVGYTEAGNNVIIKSTGDVTTAVGKLLDNMTGACTAFATFAPDGKSEEAKEAAIAFLLMLREGFDHAINVTVERVSADKYGPPDGEENWCRDLINADAELKALPPAERAVKMKEQIEQHVKDPQRKKDFIEYIDKLMKLEAALGPKGLADLIEESHQATTPSEITDLIRNAKIPTDAEAKDMVAIDSLTPLSEDDSLPWAEGKSKDG
jgi:hypothetical protein